MAYKYVSSMPGVKAEAAVSYDFICEHCGRESGTAIKIFRSLMAHPSHLDGSRPLPPEYFASMSALAKKDLKKQIDALQAQIRDGKYKNARGSLFSENSNAKCPHCGMYQSWMSTDLVTVLFNYTLIFGGAALLIFTFYTMFRYGLDNMLDANWFIGRMITFAAAGAGLITGIIDYVKTKKKTGKAAVKRLPVIHFPDTELAHTTIATIHFNPQGEATHAS